MKTQRKGFSLVDLIAVLICTALLLGLLLPVVYSAQVAAGNRRTLNNLKQICLAVHNCNDVFRKLPPAYDKFAAINFPASVQVHLLPFLEQDAVYKKYLKDEGKGEVTELTIPPFVTTDDPSSKASQKGIDNIAANLRVFATKGNMTKFDENMKGLAAVEPGQASIPRTFLDGTSNTLIFATKYGSCGKGGSKYAAAPNSAFAPFFGQNAATVSADPAKETATYQLFPADKDCRTTPLMAQSFSRTALQVGLADGSVRNIAPTLSPKTWNAALQPNDGQVLGADW